MFCVIYLFSCVVLCLLGGIGDLCFGILIFYYLLFYAREGNYILCMYVMRRSDCPLILPSPTLPTLSIIYPSLTTTERLSRNRQKRLPSATFDSPIRECSQFRTTPEPPEPEKNCQKMPRKRNSAEKKREKSAARAREHRERCGIQEWEDTNPVSQPVEASKSSGMQASVGITSVEETKIRAASDTEENQDCDSLLAEIDELLDSLNHRSPAGEVAIHIAKKDGEVGNTATAEPSTPNAEAVSARREEVELATAFSSEEEEEEEDYILDVAAQDDDLYFTE